jgi:5-formyltetrahydrofolate cyclo-ligase
MPAPSRSGPAPGPASDEKQRLRRELLALRRALPPEELRRISAAVVQRLAALPQLALAGTVLLYAAQADEVDPVALLDAVRDGRDGDAPPVVGSRIVLPRVVGPLLELAVHDPRRELAPGAFGVLEPPAGAAVVAPTAIDVALVPGVAFTADGQRLGRGGGHYDRLLATLRPDCLVIGICAEASVVPALPREAHDRPVDVLVTDASVRRRPAAGDAAPA